MIISPISRPDFDEVLELNAASVPHVNLLDAVQLQWLIDQSAFAASVRIDEKLAGFMIGFRPGTSYESPNYRWFCDNYADFAYVDRVVVSEWARRRSVAESLYGRFAESQHGVAVMTCEVNTRPANDGSMIFHERQGFRIVATQETDNGAKEVALMEKKL